MDIFALYGVSSVLFFYFVPDMISPLACKYYVPLDNTFTKEI